MLHQAKNVLKLTKEKLAKMQNEKHAAIFNAKIKILGACMYVLDC